MKSTNDKRGNGAFAVKIIPAGTYLGDYEGEMLDEAAYWARYPSGVVNALYTSNIGQHLLLQCHKTVCSNGLCIESVSPRFCSASFVTGCSCPVAQLLHTGSKLQ